MLKQNFIDKHIQKTRKELEQDFFEALKKCGMETFFSVKTFIKWITNEEKFGLNFAMGALNALIPDDDLRDNNGSELLDSAMLLANNIPRKFLKGKTPNEASMNTDEKDRIIDTYSYSLEKYLQILEKAHKFMVEQDAMSAYKTFEEAIQALFDDRIPYAHTFRVYSNSANCLFNQKEESDFERDFDLAEEILSASLRMNPLYDFGLRTKERYITPNSDLSKVSKKDIKLFKLLRELSKKSGIRKYKKTVFYEYEEFLKEIGVSLKHITKSKITTFSDKNKMIKIGRNDLCHCGSNKKF